MAYTDTSELTPDLDIQLLTEGNSAHPWFDRAIMKIDGFIMPAVKDRNVTAPPAAVAGEMWLLVGAGTGLWEDQTDKLCLYYPAFDEDLPVNVDFRDEWLFMPIHKGMQLWVIDEQVIVTRQTSSWFAAAAIANVSAGDLPAFATAVDAVIEALEQHRFLRVI